MKMVDFRKCHSWEDFRNHVKNLPEKQKGNSFEALTNHLLQLHPTYATQLKNVWLLEKVPSNIRQSLNLPDPDEGIDLIAETNAGGYWAIQCKYREDETKSLSRRELTTFTDLAFNICTSIEFALVCTNADRLSHKLKLYGERLGFCTGEVWRSLNTEFFERLHQHLDGKLAPLQPSAARQHQLRAIQNARQHFIVEENSRGKLISACGTGKSLTGYWIAKELDARNILVAVPSLALIRQTLEVWTREAIASKRKINWICVCSDKTVGEIERDDVAVLTQDLGIRVHTDPVEITQWLKARRDGTGAVFTTYQSGPATAEAARNARIVFDIGILDEAHKTTGKKESLFSHLLHDENIEIKKRIFMTATERRYLGQSDQIASMNDPELYGETFELLTFKEALESRPPILSDYRIVTILVTRSEIAALIEKNVFVRPDKGKWDKDVEAEMLAATIALRKAIQRHPIRHAVSFHSSIARARAFKTMQDNFSSALPEYGPLNTFHVSGNTPTAVRSREMDAFTSSEKALVTNARCLTEGVDVPNIDCVMFADPRKSTIDIVQAVGRALRTSHDKGLGYVVVPVLLEDEEMDESAIQSKAFDAVLITLRSLAANDDRIVEYFRGISEGRRVRGGTTPFEIDVPLGMKIDVESFVNSIELKFWSRLAKLSWRPFGEAREYARRLGLTGQAEWFRYCKGELPGKGKLPEDVPTAPQRVYANQGWLNWGDWLGTGTIAPFLREYRPFEQARQYVRTLGLISQEEWRKFKNGEMPEKGKLPDDIPAKPRQTYKNRGWVSFGDWLGTGTIAPHLREYRPFKQAREYVRNLRLESRREWRKLKNGEMPEKGKLPDDIPAAPWLTYKNDGWVSLGDWLGTGTIATHLREYRPFKQARHYVHSLRLRNVKEWRKYCKGALPQKGKLPDDIPTKPYQTYQDTGWINFGDWLGTGTIAPSLRKYRPFEQAREYVHSLGLKSWGEWKQFCEGDLLPEDLPVNPRGVYKDTGWISAGDWLGTGTVAPYLRVYRPFEEAREYVRSLGLTSEKEWRGYCKGELPEKGRRPDNIPANPMVTYKNKGWVGLGDWLGTGTIALYLRKYRPFEEAREYVRNLRLGSEAEWRKYCKGELPEKGKLPNDIPATPMRTYKEKGWVSLGDWLGTGTVATRLRKDRPFEEARNYVRNLGLKNQQEWYKYRRGELPEKGKIPVDIPNRPDSAYKDEGWAGWGDWLAKRT